MVTKLGLVCVDMMWYVVLLGMREGRAAELLSEPQSVASSFLAAGEQNNGCCCVLSKCLK